MHSCFTLIASASLKLRHLVVIVMLACSSGRGQIALDGSLGAIGPLAGPHYQIPETLGKTVGNNLFHSFQSFNLAREESATFTGSTSIANVLARVTGGTPSTIDGALRCTIPGANFYFINPAGVTFGANASVDVSGSFAVTTADYLKLGEGGRFDARNPARDVLTVAPPSAFGFLPPEQGNALGSVVFQGARLDFKDGQNVTVAAGDITVRKADPTGPSAKLMVPGKLGILSVASAGEARVDTLAVEGFLQMGEVALSEGAEFSTLGHGQDGGFLIRAGNLRLEGGSKIEQSQPNPGGGENRIELQGKLQLTEASKIESQTSGAADGMDLRMSAREVELSQASEVVCSATGSGKGGNLHVSATDITLMDGGAIGSRTEGLGDAGSVFLDLIEELLINGQNSASGNMTGVTASSENEGLGGAAGKIDIKANGIRIFNGGEIVSNTVGQGQGGSINLDVEGDLVIDGQGIFGITGVVVSSDNESLGGAAGDINIKANGIRILNGGEIDSSTWGQGQGGSISLTVENDLEADGQGSIFSYTGVQANSYNDTLGGAAGDIDIKANGIGLINSGSIDSSTFGQGHGGSVSLTVEGDLVIDGQGDFGATGVSAMSENTRLGGAAGNVVIQANGIRILNGGEITSSTRGQGHGGSVNLVVAGDLEIDGMGYTYDLTGVLASSAIISADGAAGNIEIKANGIRILNGGTIESATHGQGQGGFVSMTVEGGLEIDGKGDSIFTGVSAVSGNQNKGGDAGKIEIMAAKAQLLRGGKISTETMGQGHAGSISLKVSEQVAIDGKGLESGINSDSHNAGKGGQAGDIMIATPDLRLSNNGRVESSSAGSGKAGSVTIDCQMISLNDSQIGTAAGGKGDAGRIVIGALEKPLSVTMEKGGSISSRANTGQAGDIEIHSSDSIRVDKGAITVQSTGGDAGTVYILAPEVLILRDSTISAEAFLNGGNIRIDPRIVGLENAVLNANAVQGNGGYIGITTDFLYQLGHSRITAISENQSAQQGTVSIRSGVDFAVGLTLMTSELLDVRESLREGCARKNPRANSFLISGRGGLAMRPDSFITDFGLAAPVASEPKKDWPP